MSLHASPLSRPAEGALYTLDIGANDIGNALSGYASDDASLSKVLAQAVGDTVAAAGTLSRAGARTLLYFEVPDLSVVPAYEKYGAAAGTLASEFNQGVLSGLQTLEAQGLTVFDLPAFRAFDEVVAHPERFGFLNASSACFSGGFDTAGTACADPGQFVFWDREHPTAAAHMLSADIAANVLAGNPDPIGAPEPSTWAMMLAGLAGLGLLRRLRPRAQSVRVTFTGT